MDYEYLDTCYLVTSNESWEERSSLISRNNYHDPLSPHVIEKLEERLRRSREDDSLIIVKIEEVDSFECSLCSVTFDAHHLLEEHLATHNERDKYHVHDQCGEQLNQVGDICSYKTIHSGLKLFNCVKCEKSFSRKSCLRRHMRVHKEPAFECQICGKKFKQNFHLQTHIRIHRGEKPYKCEACGKQFNLKGNLRIHQNIHTGLKPFKCEICGRDFSQKSSMHRHQKLLCRRKLFACKICGKKFNTKVNLECHVQIHATENHFETCGEQSYQKNNLHERTHSREKFYSCETCQKRFSAKWSMERHQLIHSKPKLIKSEKSKEQSKLTNGITLMECKPCKCEICGKMFKYKSSLRLHERIHTGEKPYCCEFCGKCFSQNSSMQRHRNIYCKQKHFACKLGGKKFNNKVNLQSHATENHFEECGKLSYMKNDLHEPTRTREKSYSCETCQKKFYTKWSMERHQLIHGKPKLIKSEKSGERSKVISKFLPYESTLDDCKPYKCEICGKMFKYKSSLQLHNRIHTGEKPYCCEFCGKCFSQNSSMQRHRNIYCKQKHYASKSYGKTYGKLSYQKNKLHEQTHTVEKPYCCQTCQKRFSKKWTMERHQLIHCKPKLIKSEKSAEPSKLKSKFLTYETAQVECKPHKCEMCGKQFKYKSSLQLHNRIHTGEKPYCCEVCGRNFSQRSSMQRHAEKKHSKQKSFSCEISGKQYEQKSDLDLNERVHTQEKPHCCKLCGKQFKQKCNLEYHEKSHLGEKRPYSCQICGKKFSQKSSMRRHQRIHGNPRLLGNDESVDQSKMISRL